MCQIIPFTLPCCRKTYVEVTRVPSCPNSWPNRKCPPELCIQIRGFGPEDRDTGICWRCKALTSNISAADRESLRPRIDKATLVLGLDELGVSGRRRREESDGNCWFCSAKGGCVTCGAMEIVPVEDGDEGGGNGGGKRKRDLGGGGKRKEVKRVKVEKRDRDQGAVTQNFRNSTPSSGSRSQYPYRPAYEQNRQFHQQPRDQTQGGYASNDFPHDRQLQTDGLTHFGESSAQYPLPTNWQSVYTHQNSTPEPGPSNAYQNPRLIDDGGQGKTSTYPYPTHSYSNSQISHPQHNNQPSMYGEDGLAGANNQVEFFDRINPNDDEIHEAINSGHHSQAHLARNVANMYPEQNNTSNIYHDGQQHILYGQQDLQPQEYDENGYPPNPYITTHQEQGQDIYHQESAGQGSSNAYGGHGEGLNQLLQDFTPEMTDLDANIQPGLDILPAQCDLSRVDEGTLADLLKGFGEGNGGNLNQGMEAAQQTLNDYLGSSSSDQKTQM